MRNHSDFKKIFPYMLALICILSIVLNAILMHEAEYTVSIEWTGDRPGYLNNEEVSAKLFAPFMFSVTFWFLWFILIYRRPSTGDGWFYLIVPYTFLTLLLIFGQLNWSLDFPDEFYNYDNTINTKIMSPFPNIITWGIIVMAFAQPVFASFFTGIIVMLKRVGKKRKAKKREKFRAEMEREKKRGMLNKRKNHIRNLIEKVESQLQNLEGKEDEFAEELEIIQEAIANAEKLFNSLVYVNKYKEALSYAEKAKNTLDNIFNQIEKEKEKYSDLSNRISAFIEENPEVPIDDIKQALTQKKLEEAERLLKQRRHNFKSAKSKLERVKKKVEDLDEKFFYEGITDRIRSANKQFEKGNYEKADRVADSIENDVDELLDSQKEFSILQDKVNKLHKKNKRLKTDDIRKLLEDIEIKEASALLSEREKQYEEFLEIQQELKGLKTRIQNLTEQLTNEKISSQAYNTAMETLAQERKELEEQLWQLRSKLFKEDYEKPF